MKEKCFLGRPNRFQIMELYKNEIIDSLKAENNKILKPSTIKHVLSNEVRNWKLPLSTTYDQFIDFLVDQKRILLPLTFGFNSRPEVRYIYQNNHLSAQDLAVILYPNSYFSHSSAISIHDLTYEIEKTIYVSHENASSFSSSQKIQLEQKAIDNSFSKPMRTSTNYLDFQNQRIYMIQSKFSNLLGVIQEKDRSYTDIERTLIDIAVRPQYSGGVQHVLEVYGEAKEAASITRIIAYLKKLNYAYPYHQAIGFYLEKAGYKLNHIKKLDNTFEKKYDFYLDYNMKDMQFDSKWKIYYPSYL